MAEQFAGGFLVLPVLTEQVDQGRLALALLSTRVLF